MGGRCAELTASDAGSREGHTARKRARADARPANVGEQDATCGSPATERREQLRGLWASVARAQQSAGKQIGPSGARQGDFPRAFTHLALISAAGNLERRLG
jgi:hypothetical protein